MSATSPTPGTRPRVVNVAFWCWLAAEVLTAALGLLMITSSSPAFFRAAGGLFVVVALAHGFLTGRVRRGSQRFADAAVALAMTTVALLTVLLALFSAYFFVPFVLMVAVIMILMITGSAMVRRKPAQNWFESEAQA